MSQSFFQKNVDRRSRAAMANFLKSHCRYDTMRSWNAMTSYAQNIKIHNLGLSFEQADIAYDMLETDYWNEIRQPIDTFISEHGHSYTIGTNGRSSGYLVLYESHLEVTGHYSYCPMCGQNNYKKVPPVFADMNAQTIAQEILKNPNAHHPNVYLQQSAVQALSMTDDEKWTLANRLSIELRNCSSQASCGVCGTTRVNFQVQPKRLVVRSNGIDQGECFDPEDWTMSRLRERVDLVCAFDATCDAIRDNYIALVGNCRVVESVEYQPIVVKQLAWV